MSDTSTYINEVQHACACKNAEKKCARDDLGTDDAMMPLRNSEACGPVTERSALEGTGAIDGVFRVSANTLGGIIPIIIGFGCMFKTSGPASTE